MSVITQIHAASCFFADSDAPNLEKELIECREVSCDLSDQVVTRRAEWLSGRVVMTRIAKSCGWRGELRMHAENGYPEFFSDEAATEPSGFVSWAHSRGFAVASVAPQAVGIDTESLARPVEAVLDRIASAKEIKPLRKLGVVVQGGAVPLALALWTAKEAAAKATGLGMRWGLANFVLLPEVDGSWPVRIVHPGPRHLTEPVVRFGVREGHLVAICSERALLLKGVSWT